MTVDDEGVERLVVEAAAGDENAWRRLWAEIAGPLSRVIAQPRFLGPLGQRDDDRANVIVAVMARLYANDFRRLKMYLAAKHANPRLRFASWLRVVAKRAGVDYLRQHQDWTRRTEKDASAPGRWVDAETLPPDSQLAGGRPPITDVGTAHALLDYARDTIAPSHLRALERWLEGDSFEDIANAQGGSPRDIERNVRAVLERLRRKFREGGN